MKINRLRYRLSVIAAKMSYRALRILGRDASHFPGVLALKICPNFLKEVDTPKTIIAVTGTNGKTTVTNMIYTLLRESGEDVLCNSLGSNTYTGIASALLGGVGVGGKCKYKTAVLEVDERSSPLIYPFVAPTYLVCTNLFRDSLTRNAHTEFIKDILDGSIPKTTTLILNGDDPISSYLAPNNKRICFGIERQNFETCNEENLSRDLRICPACSSELEYDFRRYHHIGRVHCKNCDFASLHIDYSVSKINMENSEFTLCEPDGKERVYKFPNDNIINIYNYLACVAFARYYGISEEIIQRSRVSVVSSRYSEDKVGDKEILLTLSKAQNPIACTRAFSYANTLAGKKSVVLLLDEIEDAQKSPENVCWMYDADFEMLRDDNIIQVIAVGARHLDDAVRLYLAGVDPEIVTTTADYAAVSSLVSADAEKIVVLYDLHCVGIAKKLKNQLKSRFEGGEVNET